MSEISERLRDLLLLELRRAIAARLESGADPRRVTADLEHRLQRMRAAARPRHYASDTEPTP